jgi:hypothetical protein
MDRPKLRYEMFPIVFLFHSSRSRHDYQDICQKRISIRKISRIFLQVYWGITRAISTATTLHAHPSTWWEYCIFQQEKISLVHPASWISIAKTIPRYYYYSSNLIHERWLGDFHDSRPCLEVSETYQQTSATATCFGVVSGTLKLSLSYVLSIIIANKPTPLPHSSLNDDLNDHIGKGITSLDVWDVLGVLVIIVAALASVEQVIYPYGCDIHELLAMDDDQSRTIR